jgi:hypothetical protein
MEHDAFDLEEQVYLQDTREIIAENLLTRREQLGKTQEELSKARAA